LRYQEFGEVFGKVNGSFSVFAGWVVDGTGGPMQRDVLLTIEGGSLVAIESLSNVKDKPAPFVDFSDCTVLPGLVDSHVHLFMSGTANKELRERQLGYGFEEVRDIISQHIQRHLAHGVVALRDGGDYAGHSLRYKNECLPQSKLPIYLRSPGRAWRARGRYGRLIGRPPHHRYTLAQSIALCEEKVDHIKIVNSGLNSLRHLGKETSPQFTLDELTAAVDAGKQTGLKTMVHANGLLPVRLAVRAGCDSVEHGFFMGRENLEELAGRQVIWVPTAYTMRAYAGNLERGSREADIALRNLESQMEQLMLARRLGLPVALGTDCGSLGVDHGNSFREEFGILMEAGFPVEEATRCATFNGARLLGLEKELGQIKEGMPATCVIVRGGPSSLPESMASPEAVYVGGERVLSGSNIGCPDPASRERIPGGPLIDFDR
jgi:imidazolonepropionase-like amidohydrolase